MKTERINPEFDEENPDFKPEISWYEIIVFLCLVAFVLYVLVKLTSSFIIFKFVCYTVLIGLGIFSIIWFVKHNIFEK